jgi:hypothetical protein
MDICAALPEPQKPLALSSGVVFRSEPFGAATRHALSIEGRSISRIVEALNVPEQYAGYVRVWIDDREVPQEYWSQVRPREGHIVYVAVVPQGGGGGGKNLIRTIAFIAVAIIAISVAPQISGALVEAGALSAEAAAFTIGGVNIVNAGIAAGVSMIGNALVNALIPPPKSGFDVNSLADANGITQPRYQLTGAQNRLSPYANIPRVFGKRRMYPLLASLPYSELQGSTEYMRLALLVGWGPIKITDIRIGETPLASFADVEVEVREGWPTDQPLSLFTRSVEQQNFSVAMEPSVWNLRTTDTGVTEISVDIAFPGGLAFYNDDGGRSAISVSFDVQYSVAGANSWQSPTWSNAIDAGFGTAGVITVSGADASTVRASGRFSVPKGRYDVRIRRTTALRGARYVESAVWNVLRYVTDSQPIIQKNICLIAMRIKATGQLNGVPSSINCIAESYLPVYSGAAWSYQITRNPAWAFADILRRRNGAPWISDDRLDLPAITAWAAACEATAPNASEPYWRFDGIFEGGSAFQALKLVSSHARSQYTMRDGKHSVVRDIAQSVPVQHITPRNSFNYRGSKTFTEKPNALRVRFVNAEQNYNEDEVIVYADGFNAENASSFESIDLPACTSSTQAWREGRYQHAVGRLRPEEHQVSMDVEAMRCTLGDFVLFTHDAVSIGLSSSRIKSLILDGSGYVSGITLEDEVLFAEGVVRNYVLRLRRKNGDSALISLVSNVQGFASTVYPITAIPPGSAPEAGDLVMFGEATRETAPMLVKRVDPGPDLSVRLTLVDAQPGVWTADTGTIPAFDSYISVQTPPSEARPGVPTISRVRSDETALLRLSDGTLQDRVFVEIAPPASSVVRVASYEVQIRQQGAAVWIAAPRVLADAQAIFLSGVEGGTAYEIRVRAISEASVAGEWSPVLLHTVVGKTTPPDTPAAFTGESRVDGVQLSWAASPSPDVVGYTIKLGVSWQTATLVTERFAGTSLFVGLDATTPQTFLIRAVDAVGLESEPPLTVVASPGAPDDVTEFNVYSRFDYVAASWRPVDGVGIEYEVRAGSTWATSNVIGRTSGDKLETQYPVRSSGDVTYWIKAVSPAGRYSLNAAFASTRQAPIPNRNIVIEKDWSSLGYPGVRLDLAVNGSALELVTVSGVNRKQGDYYAKLSLPASYYARSWTEIASSSASRSGVTWTQASYAWQDAGSATWQGTLGESEAGLVSAFISRYLGTLASGEVEGFRLAGSLNGVGGTTPVESQDAIYSVCHFDNGLEVVGSTKAAWNVSVPSTFSLLFDFRADTFVDQDAALVTLRAGSGWLRLVWDAVLDQFALLDHIGNRVAINVPVETGDVVTFGISQSLSSRSLYAATRRYPVPAAASITAGPVGNFTQVALTA